jgi:hypothetical protein
MAWSPTGGVLVLCDYNLQSARRLSKLPVVEYKMRKGWDNPLMAECFGGFQVAMQWHTDLTHTE